MNSSEIATDTVAEPMKNARSKPANTWRRNMNVPIFSCLVALGCIVGVAETHADNEPSVLVRADADSKPQQASPASRRELKERVKTALHVDPYFYDRHVTVSVENDAVVLRGFVFSQEDLLDALRIARSAAGDKPVINQVTITLGPRK